jgi:hypothetical protein
MLIGMKYWVKRKPTLIIHPVIWTNLHALYEPEPMDRAEVVIPYY